MWWPHTWRLFADTMETVLSSNQGAYFSWWYHILPFLADTKRCFGERRSGATKQTQPFHKSGGVVATSSDGIHHTWQPNKPI